jgi:hypothetical protein
MIINAVNNMPKNFLKVAVTYHSHFIFNYWQSETVVHNTSSWPQL